MKRGKVQTTLGDDATVCKRGRGTPDYRDLREAPPDSAPRAEDCDAYWAARTAARADPPVPVATDEADRATPGRPAGVPCVQIVSWNVAGFRAVLKKGFRDYVAREQPDVLCLQETKVAERMVPAKELPAGYASVTFYECEDTPGRHGTALLSRAAPLAVHRGLGDPALDHEGRVITAEYASFFVVCTYVPNSSEGLVHWAYRRRWDDALLAHLQKLDAQKPVVWCGDLNVAHRWIDIYNPKAHVCSHRFLSITTHRHTTFLTCVHGHTHFFFATSSTRRPGFCTASGTTSARCSRAGLWTCTSTSTPARAGCSRSGRTAAAAAPRTTAGASTTLWSRSAPSAACRRSGAARP